MKKFGLFLILSLSVVVGYLFFHRRSNPVPSQAPETAADSNASLAAKAQEALALTENLDPEKAAPLWQAIVTARPSEAELVQNLAVNAYLAYSRRAEKIKNPDTSTQDSDRLRQSAPGLYEQAENAIKRLQELAPEQPAGRWMESRLRLEQAKLLPSVLTEGVQREVIGELLKSMEKQPALELMGMQLELIDMPGLQDLRAKLSKIVANMAELHPRNLVLLLEHLQRSIEQKSDGTTIAVERLVEACQPVAQEFESTLGRTLAELVTEVKQSLAAKDWASAEGAILGWGNVLRATAPCRTDLQRMNPHVLDFLSTAAVYSLNQEPTIDTPSRFANVKFTTLPNTFSEPMVGAARAIVACDMDLDDQPEIAALVGEELIVWKSVNHRLEVFARAPVAADDKLLMWADLHLVDSHGPDHLIARRTAKSDEEGARLDRAHNTYVSFVVAGSAGVTVWRCAPEAASPELRLLKPSKATGLEAVAGVTAMTRGDVEADGDLDLIFGTEQGMQLWINRGNMTFRAASIHSQFPAATSPVVSLAIGDVDRDLDLDLVTLQADGTVGWLENLLHQQFRWSALETLRFLGAGGIEIADLNGDVSWDVIVSSPERLGWSYSATPAAGNWRLQKSEQGGLGGCGLRLVDANSDSWQDAVVWGPSGLRVYLGMAPGSFAKEAIELHSSELLAVDVEDFDGDGKMDLVGVTANGALLQLRNATETVGHSLAIRYKGIDDNATGRVNHYAIGSIVEVWFNSRYRAAVVKDRTTRFGLGSAEQATTLRAVFTNGVTQHLLAPKLDTMLEEKQELKGSCPYLYSWDGEKFVFVTDCLWAAPLGLQVAQGKVAADRPWEYLLVPGQHVMERDGNYELRLSEELWEIGYFDQIELTAVDHPQGTVVYTNEKVGPPQIAEHKLFSFDRWNAPRSARDSQGRDATQKLAAIDRNFVQGFEYRVRQGLTEPHWIELDLGDIAAGDQVVLALTGWILPTDSSLNIAIDQNPELSPLQFPSVWVPAGDGWREAIPFMGFPGGKTKTIVVDLTKVVRAEDPRVQIRTSAQIYWDHAAIAINPQEIPVKTLPIALTTAELGWHGFSELIGRRFDEPQRYDYDRPQQIAKWPPLGGGFTRYGPVDDLLKEWDDKMVVLGPGDEIRLKFSTPDTKPPAGWVRDFVMHNVGWDKDADLNTLTGQSVEPIPSKTMRTYPPRGVSVNRSASIERNNSDRRDRVQSFRAFWRRN